MADNNNKPTILDFGEEEKGNSIIKVIGVGAVSYTHLVEEHQPS